MIEIALYQPDIAPNAATIARLCACFGIKLTIIEPAGFAWAVFKQANAARRIVLLSTKAQQSYLDFSFAHNDILLLGRESAGMPPDVQASLPHQIKIPMNPGLRSLNVAMAASMVTGEALRQLNASN
jgi:tRNA (cytidine/uridine-2'-O-)-methyltransferase